jgi:hypothetical protein
MAISYADGIEYSRVPGFDRDLFRCSTWRATLSVPACAGRWREAQVAKRERAEELRLCRGCEIGAAHAGEKFIERASNFMDKRCPRCRRGTMRRLIGQRLCISCYNRGREQRLGRNAKGSAPIKANSQLAVRTIGIILDVGEATERAVRFSEVAIDTRELELLVGRVHEGKIRFCDPADSYPTWRPKALGDHKIKDLPIARAHLPPPHRAHSSPLRRAALSSSCFSPSLHRFTHRPCHLSPKNARTAPTTTTKPTI